MKTILLTGATGFIGEYILNNIRRNNKVVVLVRKKSLDKLGNNFTGNNVSIVIGDVTSKKSLMSINEKPDYIIHCAALYDTTLNKDILSKANISGVNNIIAYAKTIKKLKCLCHISTIYVSGNSQCEFPEDSLSKVTEFHNNYEETKYIGEKAVRNSGLPFIIYRPPIVVGDSRSGKIKTLNGLYKTLNIIKSGKLFFYPGDCHGKLYISPVDIVSDFITKSYDDKRFIGKTFNMVENNPETYRQFINRTIRYLSLGKPYFTFPSFLWKWSMKLSGIRSLGIFNQQIKYVNDNYVTALKTLRLAHPKIAKYYKPLMKYYLNAK